MSNFNVPSYETRVAAMKKPADAARQVKLARRYLVNLKAKGRRDPALAQSQEHKAKLVAAELVLQKLRRDVFGLEEQLEKREAEEKRSLEESRRIKLGAGHIPPWLDCRK